MQKALLKTESQEFLEHFYGSFTNMLRWPQLETLWQVLKLQNTKQWFLYATNQPAPSQVATHDELVSFIDNVDSQIRQLHKYDYCGIVYVDAPESPNFIKIYHPKNLGASCGSSGNRPIPGWIFSTMAPIDLIVEQDNFNTGNWKRFTQFMKFSQ
ncbi:MAG: hypothetical protein ACC653_03110 [Gammaproteobacteria bacterium]